MIQLYFSYLGLYNWSVHKVVNVAMGMSGLLERKHVFMYYVCYGTVCLARSGEKFLNTTS